MKTENRSRWMIWAIVILVVMNLTTIITVVHNKKQLSDNGPLPSSDQGMSESASMQYSGRYFRDSLGLNMEQMKKFSEFNPGFRQSVMAINKGMSEKRHEMLVEMAKNECDTNKLNVLSDSIGFLHARLKKETYQYYINFKKICNQEQQKKLKQIFGAMFNNDMQMVMKGRGTQSGRRMGWRNTN
jgi:Spy/CpxP family protein refolding chaperone